MKAKDMIICDVTSIIGMSLTEHLGYASSYIIVDSRVASFLKAEGETVLTHSGHCIWLRHTSGQPPETDRPFIEAVKSLSHVLKFLDPT